MLSNFNICYECGVFGAKKRCTSCKQVVYCGRPCQEKSWNAHHSSDCKYMKMNPFPTKLNAEKDYLISIACRTSVAALYTNSLSAFVIFGLCMQHRCMVNIQRYAWKGVFYDVYCVTPLITEKLLEQNVPLGRGNLISACTTCAIVHQEHIPYEDIYKQSMTGGDMCKCQEKLVLTWLLVCKRLDVLPTEICYMIGDYAFADIRLCDSVRHKVFPIGGELNTYML